MTRFYFVRHGKTQWNLEGRYQGAHGDSPLLATSFQDIKLLAQRLQGINIDHIYTSPLPRAALTAQALDYELGNKIPLTKIAALKEFDLGILEGEKFVTVEQKYPHLIWAFRHDPSQYQAQLVQGESFAEVIQRTTKFVVDLARQDADNRLTLLIVSHGGCLTAMIKSLIGVPLRLLRQDGGLSNTSLTTVDTYDQGKTFHLIQWNDTSFLQRHLNKSDTV